MNINVNHPSFVKFLEQITNHILKSVNVGNYFTLNIDKKITFQYAVFKLIKSAVSVRAKLSDAELKSFIVVLWKRNEDSENYEIASVLNDIKNNFDLMNEVTKSTKTKNKNVKIDTK